jgi:hypothetical protein
VSLLASFRVNISVCFSNARRYMSSDLSARDGLTDIIEYRIDRLLFYPVCFLGF